MKRNLLGGIIFIGMVILSSCSVPNQLSAVKNIVNDDDVYYTKAKAGDQINYFADNNYTGDDDYYYYGDYTTRLNRFANYSPFDYNDDFYYTYSPYNNGFGEGLNYNLDYYGYNYGYGKTTNDANNYIGSAYSPYDFGYSPFYDSGYDDYGYGDIYAAYILGGGGGYGGSYRHHHNTSTTKNQTGYNPNVRGIRTTPSPGVTRIAAYGKPNVNINNINGTRVTAAANGLNTAAARQARDNNVYRPQQTQSFNNNNSSNSVSSGSGTSSSVSSGGGGRPARP